MHARTQCLLLWVTEILLQQICPGSLTQGNVIVRTQVVRQLDIYIQQCLSCESTWFQEFEKNASVQVHTNPSGLVNEGFLKLQGCISPAEHRLYECQKVATNSVCARCQEFIDPCWTGLTVFFVVSYLREKFSQWYSQFIQSLHALKQWKPSCRDMF